MQTEDPKPSLQWDHSFLLLNKHEFDSIYRIKSELAKTNKEVALSMIEELLADLDLQTEKKISAMNEHKEYYNLGKRLIPYEREEHNSKINVKSALNSLKNKLLSMNSLQSLSKNDLVYLNSKYLIYSCSEKFKEQWYFNEKWLNFSFDFYDLFFDKEIFFTDYYEYCPTVNLFNETNQDISNYEEGEDLSPYYTVPVEKAEELLKKMQEKKHIYLEISSMSVKKEYEIWEYMLKKVVEGPSVLVIMFTL